MGSPLGGWPSHNPQNFSQLVPADSSAQPTNVTPTTYIAVHGTDPPPNQVWRLRNHHVFHNTDLQPVELALISQEEIVVITTEPTNILLRHFYKNSENKPRPKRAAPDGVAPRNGKQARSPADGGASQSSTRS